MRGKLTHIFGGKKYRIMILFKQAHIFVKPQFLKWVAGFYSKCVLFPKINEVDEVKQYYT